jgi:hypothetical protein
MKTKSRMILTLVLLLFVTSCVSEQQNETLEQDEPLKENETLDLVVYAEENKISIMEMSGRKIENVTFVDDNDDHSYKLTKWNSGGNRIAFLIYDLGTPAELVFVDYSIEGNFYYKPFLEEGEEDRISTKFLDSRSVVFRLDVEKLFHNDNRWCKDNYFAYDWISEDEILFLCQDESSETDTLSFCTFSIAEIDDGVANVSCTAPIGIDQEENFKSIDYFSEGNKILLASQISDQWNIYLSSEGSERMDYLFEGYSPAWSSDGERIAYGNGLNLYLYNMNDETHELLYESGETSINPFHPKLSEQEFTFEWLKNILVFDRGISWGKNDEKILFTAARYPASMFSIYAIDLETLKVSPLSVDISSYPDFYSFPVTENE